MSSKEKRNSLINALFPSSIPLLWCPPLTHYKENGEIDFERMRKHIQFLLPSINSFLIPGSTGDGWEITLREYKAILEFVHKEFGSKGKINLIIGLLRTNKKERKVFLDYAVKFLKVKGIETDANKSDFSYFKGFVVCAEKGKNLTQEEIKTDLIDIIKQNFPTVLYQLPQVTDNELSPDLVEYLVQTYYNVYMLKDSSGEDKIVNAEKDYQNLILLRGAEGNYYNHCVKNGGKYAGFLLSTGNSFPHKLRKMVDLIEKGEKSEAKEISEKLTEATNLVFKIAEKIPEGNAFTNSNKLIDHINAYGKEWRNFPLPVLHSGRKIDLRYLEQTEKILQKYNLIQVKGYAL